MALAFMGMFLFSSQVSRAEWILVDYADGVAGGGHDVAILNGGFEDGIWGNSPFPQTLTPKQSWTSATAPHTGTNSAALNWESTNPVGDGGPRSVAHAQDTQYRISVGDQYALSFWHYDEWQNFSWWSRQDVGWALYYTADNTRNGTPTVLFQGIVYPADRIWNKATLGTVTVTEAQGAAGATGKHLWLSFHPAIDCLQNWNSALVDSVTLVVVNRNPPPKGTILIVR